MKFRSYELLCKNFEGISSFINVLGGMYFRRKLIRRNSSADRSRKMLLRWLRTLVPLPLLFYLRAFTAEYYMGAVDLRGGSGGRKSVS